MKFFKKSLLKFGDKNKKISKYEEIFSTTENKLNLQNTSPLEVPDVQPSSDFVNVESILPDEFLNKTRTAELLSEEASYLYPEITEPQDEQTIKSLKEKLKKEIKFLKLKTFAFVFLFILSLTLDVLIQIKPAFLAAIPINILTTYLISSTVILLLSFVFGFKHIKSAFVHLSYAVFAPDTAIIFPFLTTFINCVTSLVYSIIDTSFRSNTFVSLFIFNFLLLNLNSLAVKKRILNNLKFVTSSKQKYNIDVYTLDSILTSVKSKKKIFSAYQHKSNFLANFLRNSHKETLTESIISKIIPVSIIFSVLCGILNLVLTQNPVLSLVALNISSLICFPFAVCLAVNLIVSSLCKYTLKIRTMVVGENAVRKLSKVNSVVLNDSDLYPPNNVVLRGIKTFNGQRIDEAILFAAALLCRINAPISQVFDKIIMGKKNILTNASDIVYKEEKGIVGWVNGKRILVGNRELLKEFKISLPSRDYENKYRIPNCELTYFAIGQSLVAMFILEYTPSKSLCNTLRSCVKNDIKIFVKTVDSNLTTNKIAADFNLNEKFLTLLSYDESQTINKLCNKTSDKSEAFLATFGSCSSFLKTICACCLAKNNIILASAMQFLQIILNIILTLYLIFCSSLSELHTIELTIYSLLWFVSTIAISKIKTKIN